MTHPSPTPAQERKKRRHVYRTTVSFELDYDPKDAETLFEAMKSAKELTANIIEGLPCSCTVESGLRRVTAE